MLFLCIEDIDNQKGLLLQLSSGSPDLQYTYILELEIPVELEQHACLRRVKFEFYYLIILLLVVEHPNQRLRMIAKFRIFFSSKTKLLNKITLVIINYIPNGTCISSINERASLFISRYLNTLSEKPPKYVQPSVTPKGVDSADLKLKQTLNAFFHKSRESL